MLLWYSVHTKCTVLIWFDTGTGIPKLHETFSRHFFTFPPVVLSEHGPSFLLCLGIDFFYVLLLLSLSLSLSLSLIHLHTYTHTHSGDCFVVFQNLFYYFFCQFQPTEKKENTIEEFKYILFNRWATWHGYKLRRGWGVQWSTLEHRFWNHLKMWPVTTDQQSLICNIDLHIFNCQWFAI